MTKIKIFIKKYLFVWLGLLLIATTALTMALAPRFGQMSTTPVIQTASPYEFAETADDQPVDLDEWSNQVESQPNIESQDKIGILLLGQGGPGHQGGALSDAIQLLYIDKTKQKIALISIPRDLAVQLPSGKTVKINSAIPMSGDKTSMISGGKIGKSLATQLSGLPVQYFIAVNFVGFERLIGQDLGGIEVNVAETLEDAWYPIRGEELNPCGHTPEEIAQLTATKSGFELEKEFVCRYEHLLFKPGINKMQGGETLKYVRSRHGSGSGDFSRGQRQQEVLIAISKKLISLEALKNLDKIYIKVVKNVSSDLDLEGARRLAAALPSLASWPVTNINLNTSNVLTSGPSSTIMPKAGINNWTEVHNYISQQMN